MTRIEQGVIMANCILDNDTLRNEFKFGISELIKGGYGKGYVYNHSARRPYYIAYHFKYGKKDAVVKYNHFYLEIEGLLNRGCLNE